MNTTSTPVQRPLFAEETSIIRSHCHKAESIARELRDMEQRKLALLADLAKSIGAIKPYSNPKASDEALAHIARIIEITSAVHPLQNLDEAVNIITDGCHRALS